MGQLKVNYPITIGGDHMLEIIPLPTHTEIVCSMSNMTGSLTSLFSRGAIPVSTQDTNS